MRHCRRQKASTDSITVVVNNGTYLGGVVVTQAQARAAGYGEDSDDYLALNIIAKDSSWQTRTETFPWITIPKSLS